MCGGMGPENPEKRLSELIERELGIVIPATSLRLFVRYHWRELTVLAHRIHGADAGGHADVVFTKRLEA